MFLDVGLPVAFQVERVRRVFLNPHVCVWVEVCDLFAAVTPQTFESVVGLLPVHLNHMLLQRLQVVQLSGAVLPHAFIRLVASDRIRDTWRPGIDADGLVAAAASRYVAQAAGLRGLVLAGGSRMPVGSRFCLCSCRAVDRFSPSNRAPSPLRKRLPVRSKLGGRPEGLVSDTRGTRSRSTRAHVCSAWGTFGRGWCGEVRQRLSRWSATLLLLFEWVDGLR
jgi:hypothetical protein